MRRWGIIVIAGLIGGILAVIAIPFYTGQVERARVTEASSIMGAIITSQKVEKRRAGKYYSASTIAEFQAKGIDVSDTKFCTYETTPTPNGVFIVTATPTDAFGAAGYPFSFTYDPTRTPPGRWGDEDPILKDWLLIHT